MGAKWTQIFPPPPTFTEKDIPGQKGKTFVITGGGSGAGLELAKILYAAGGNVIITSRTETKAKLAVESIKTSSPTSTAGQVDFVILDYSDLSTVKSSAHAVLAKCSNRIDVLWNNAGISLSAPHGSKSAQGHDLITATNCLGPLLFTRLVLPALEARASESTTRGSVRIIWTASFSVDGETPKGGFKMEDVKAPKGRDAIYAISKTGNWFLASELGREMAPGGVLNLCVHPGQMDTPLLKDLEWWRSPARLLLHPPKMGAYTELYAGLSGDFGMVDVGGFVIPWGRKHPSPREDLLKCMKTEEEGGTGLTKEFVCWCEEQTAPFL
ncbi:hypothetical protein GE09DRAFT_75217 [Coniochaeta sp. 2T2.1]|nr:hypothetical protein GE09DRAFT_75217 [Coniochaeta sp. 2T2.1]